MSIYFSVPFNWKNPIGYTILTAGEGIAVWHMFCFISCLVTLGAGVLIFIIAMTKDIKSRLAYINKRAKRKKFRIEAMQKFSIFIQIETSAKQLSFQSLTRGVIYKVSLLYSRILDNYAEFYQPLIVVLFLWGLGSLCGALLLNQMGLV